MPNEVYNAKRREYTAARREHVNARQRAWYAANKHKRSEETRAKDAAARRMRDYGTDGAELWTGQCGVCKTPLDSLPPKQVHLDHSHTSGRVRGWLCKQCNIGLGHFRDNPALLNAAAEYLKRGSDNE